MQLRASPAGRVYKEKVKAKPAEDADPIAADSIAGFELQDPFGQ